MNTDGLLLMIAGVKIFPLQHPRDIVMGAELDQGFRRHRPHPAAIEFHGGSAGIENFKNLPLVGLRVRLHLLFRERHTSLRHAGGIAYHPGKVADEKDDFMSQILKMFQLVNQDGMAQVEIRRRGIESSLDAQGPVFF